MPTTLTKPLIIRPYSMRSKSAKELATALGCQRSLIVNPTTHNVINWGGGGSPFGLNKPLNVSLAINKIKTFQFLTAGGRHGRSSPVRMPDWTTSKDIAEKWINQGETVLCRQQVDGHSGNGIVVARISVDLVDAPLYTKFVNKDQEFRIHVFNGKVIDQRQKVPARDGRAITSQYINTHSNGYVFNFADAPLDAKIQAINAVLGLGLDFGAVDVIVKNSHSPGQSSMNYSGAVYNTTAYVLEVNTAPGLQGSTIQAYATAIRKRFNQAQ